MTVIFEKRSLPVISVAFAVKTGGVNESEEEKGISHFIEHLLYKGTPKRNAQMIAEEIEKNGGILNGFTDQELTAYWCKMPSSKLNIALEVLGDMVKNPLFDEKEIEKERKVIFEEIKMYNDSPHLHAIDEIHRNLYKKPFGSALIGTEKTLGAMTRKKILTRFKKIYQPNNMILCVVGDADFKDIISFAEKNFGKTKGQNPKFQILKTNSSRTEKRKGIDQANIVFAYHVPLARDKKSYSAFVLNTLMAGGMSSRLFHEIREKRNLAYSVQGESHFSRNFAYNLIYVGTKKENIDQIKEIVLKEFEKISKEIPEKEFAQVKEQIIGNYQISFEDSNNQMTNLILNEINGDAKETYELEKKIRAVKLKDVKKMAGKVRGKNYSFFALVPE